MYLVKKQPNPPLGGSETQPERKGNENKLRKIHPKLPYVRPQQVGGRVKILCQGSSRNRLTLWKTFLPRTPHIWGASFSFAILNPKFENFPG